MLVQMTAYRASWCKLAQLAWQPYRSCVKQYQTSGAASRLLDNRFQPSHQALTSLLMPLTEPAC